MRVRALFSAIYRARTMIIPLPSRVSLINLFFRVAEASARRGSRLNLNLARDQSAISCQVFGIIAREICDLRLTDVAKYPAR